MITLPHGQYKPGATFDADGRRWHIHSVAHTGRSLQANAFGYPWRDETFTIDAPRSMIIREYVIELQIYHDEIIGRLQFTNPDTDTVEQSGLYSLPELNNIVAMWQDDALMGSFTIGTKLARDARLTLTSKADPTC